MTMLNKAFGPPFRWKNSHVLLNYRKKLLKMARKKQKWQVGDYFGIPIEDDFIKAYFSLAPWDDWHDPEYLDKLLISPDKKPESLIYKNK